MKTNGDSGTIIVIKEDNTIDAFGDNATAFMNFVNGTDLPEEEAVPEMPKGLTASECEQLALSYLKRVLKNPESLQVHSTSSTKTEDSYLVTIGYSAMNGFGGYNRETFICLVGKDGVITAADSF